MGRGLRNKVAVVGAGTIAFGELYDKTFEQMISEAYSNCLESVDKGIDPGEIEAAWYGTARGPGTGASLGETLGLHGRPITRVENACATGGDAFRNATIAVAAGLYDVALVVGCEKMTDLRGGLIQAVAEQEENFWQWAVTLPSAFGLYATRHIARVRNEKGALSQNRREKPSLRCPKSLLPLQARGDPGSMPFGSYHLMASGPLRLLSIDRWGGRSDNMQFRSV